MNDLKRKECSSGSSISSSRRRLGLRIVMISDTHGRHADIDIRSPKGERPADVLICAGDFTRYGRLSDAESFNEWIGKTAKTIPIKVVVNGNHEHNAPWKKDVRKILSNLVFLKDEGRIVVLRSYRNKEGKEVRRVVEWDRRRVDACDRKRVLSGGDDDKDEAGDDLDVTTTEVKIWGTNFLWPMRSSSPPYDAIPRDVDILVSHGPCKGHVDGGVGCTALRDIVSKISPRLVVSGHIHKAHGTTTTRSNESGAWTTYVNAANSGNGHGRIANPAVWMDI